MSPPSPLWYASRGLGLALLVVLTATVILGIVTGRRWRSETLPLFVATGLHRNLSLLALAMLPLHALGVVLDSYAHLGLKDVVVPFASSYRQLWLGLGVLSGELLTALVATSLLRRRVGYPAWRLIHWSAYAAWPLAVLHGLGTGSDARAGWALVLYTVCVLAVLVALLIRLSGGSPETLARRRTASVLAVTGSVALAVWTMAGPLQPGWALTAGTPRSLIGAQAAATAPAEAP